LLLLAILLLASAAGTAHADDHGGGGHEVRVAGTCGRGAVATLRVRAEEHGLEVRFGLRETRGHGWWRIAIVHEHRISARATRRTTRQDDSFELRRSLPDLPGSDNVVAHAWGPSGVGCQATATLPG
jgi:hypothetical protein